MKPKEVIGCDEGGMFCIPVSFTNRLKRYVFTQAHLSLKLKKNILSKIPARYTEGKAPTLQKELKTAWHTAKAITMNLSEKEYVFYTDI